KRLLALLANLSSGLPLNVRTLAMADCASQGSHCPSDPRLDRKKSVRVKRLTPSALAICENTIVCDITVMALAWAHVNIPSSSTSKPPVAARRDLCGEWYPSHLRSFPGASSLLPLFFRSHMTTLGRPARL